MALLLLALTCPLPAALAQDGAGAVAPAAAPPPQDPAPQVDPGGGGEAAPATDPGGTGDPAAGAEGAAAGEAATEAPAESGGPALRIVQPSEATPRAGGLRPPVDAPEQPSEAGADEQPDAEGGDATPGADAPGAPDSTPHPTGWADADTATRLALREMVITEQSSAAEAFAQSLGTLLAQELEIQEYERGDLGAEDITKLGGHRLKRRTRIDRDAVDFVARAGRFARKALAVPRPTSQARLTRDQIAFLAALHTAYEESRDLQRLKAIIDRNTDFRTTANWQPRDQAVKLRDELIEVETTFTSLVDRAWLLYTGDASDATLEEMETELSRIAPEALVGGGDVATLVLTNAALQQQVVAEVAGILKSPRVTLTPTESAAELSKIIGPLYQKLLETSGVTPLHEQQNALDAELAQIDAKLLDIGVNMLDPPERRAITRRKAEIEKELARLGNQWRSTPPDRKTANTLIAAQDKLLRRGLFDLGVTGALFGHRYDEVHALMAPDLLDDAPSQVWMLLENQAELLQQLSSAAPARSLLDDLSPPRLPTLSPAAVMAQLQKNPNLLKALPKPKPGKQP